MISDNLIDSIKDNDFQELALQFYEYQSKKNPVYREYLQLLGKADTKVSAIEDIPFLPISFFKNKVVKSGSWSSAHKFYSSTTTGMDPSIHYIRDLDLYQQICRHSFRSSMGLEASEYVWVGLLPSYLDRQNASLVHMVSHFMDISEEQDEHHFYLLDFRELFDQLNIFRKQNKKVILVGVTFALIDFAKNFQGEFENLIIIETGGMKGRGSEPVRAEIHDFLRRKLKPSAIGSEYGMTELMSQAYLLDDEYFTCPQSMKVLPRDITDPLSKAKYGKTCCLNIIDLGNVHSCCFLATDDLGVVEKNGKFKVLGRLDHAEIRGCSLMYV